MARLSTYAIDGTPVSSDKLIGTDTAGTVTKNYPLGDVADWLKSSGATAVLGQNNYLFQIALDPDEGRKIGSFSFDRYGGDGTDFSAVAELKFSASSSTGQYVADYLLSTVGQKVLISQLDAPNNFGIYALVSLTQSSLEPTFYNAVLAFVDGNGALQGNESYGLATYSALNEAGGGGTWGSITGDIDNQTDLVNYIDNAIAGVPVPPTPTLQSVTDEGNTTTNSIGIGISSPDYPLHVAGNSLVTGTQFIGDTFTRIQQGSGNLLLSNSFPTGGVVIRTNGVEKMRVDADGKVGIGTTAPNKTLDIRTNGPGDGMRLATSENALYAEIINGNSESFPSGKINLRYGPAFTAGIVALSNSMVLSGGYTTAGYIRFRSHTTEVMRMTNVGLGIGTTSPDEKLRVDGNIKSAGDFIGSAVRLGFAGTANITTYDTNEDLLINPSGSGDILMQTTSGNVGIGTTAPSTSLHIKSTSAGSGYATIENTVHIAKLSLKSSSFTGHLAMDGTGGYISGGGLILDSGTNPRIQFLQNGSSKMAIVNGNVGIGATAPALQSGGTGLHINAPTSSEIKFTNSTTGATASDGTALVSNGTGFTINNREAGSLTLGTNNSTRLYIDSAGKVGIGTTVPTEKLHITGGGAGNIRLDTGGTYYGTNIQAISGAGLKIGNDDFSGYAFFADDSNVGIGTTTPSEKLEVNGNVKASKVLVNTTNAGYTFYSNGESRINNITFQSVGNDDYLQKSASDGRFWIRNGRSGQSVLLGANDTNGQLNDYLLIDGNTQELRIRTASSDRLVVNSNGNVGIGTTAPSAKLNVRGDNNQSTTGVLEIGTSGTSLRLGGNTTYSWIQTHSSKPLYINELGNNVILNGYGGNVGIGTTAPTAKLHVVGTNSIIDNQLKLGNRTGQNGKLILQGNNGPNFSIEGVNDVLHYNLVTGSPNGGSIQFNNPIRSVLFNHSVGGRFWVRYANTAITDNNGGGLFIESQTAAGSNGRAVYVSADTNGGIIRSTSYGAIGTTGFITIPSRRKYF